MSYDKAVLPDEVIMWPPSEDDDHDAAWIVMVGENGGTQKIEFDDHDKAVEFTFAEAKRLDVTAQYAGRDGVRDLWYRGQKPNDCHD